MIASPEAFITTLRDIARLSYERKRRVAPPNDLAVLRYVNSSDVQASFANFMWQYVGKPLENSDLAADPAIIEGNYRDKIKAKYTEDGKFILLRKRPDTADIPESYYGVVFDTADRSVRRLYLLGHACFRAGKIVDPVSLIPHEDNFGNRDGVEERYIFSTENRAYDIAALPERRHTNDPLLDELDYREMLRLHYHDMNELPQLVFGAENYFQEGGQRELLSGNLGDFLTRVDTFQRYFGGFVVDHATEPINTIVSLPEPATIIAA